MPEHFSPEQTEKKPIYRSELDVYGVIARQLLLQVLELPYVLAAPCLHQIFKMEHSWVSAIQNDHRAEVWESGGGNRNMRKFWSSGSCSCWQKEPFRRVTSATVPGAPDVSWTGRLDLWTHLSQHVTEVLGPELRRTDDGLTSDLWGEEQRSSGSACPSTEQRKGTERSTHLSQCELRLLQLVRRIHTHLLGGEARKRWRWWWDWK